MPQKVDKRKLARQAAKKAEQERLEVIQLDRKVNMYLLAGCFDTVEEAMEAVKREAEYDAIREPNEFDKEVEEWHRQRKIEQEEERKIPLPLGHIKLGRICMTCKHRLRGRNGEFVRCKVRERLGYPKVWSMAKCNLWQLTKDKMRLALYDEHTEIKVCKAPYAIRNLFYSKYNDCRLDEQGDLELGRACFFCEYRGAKYREHIECNRRQGQMVWRRAVCSGFKLFTDGKSWLPRMARYLRKSGDSLDRLNWWKAKPYEPGRSKMNNSAFWALQVFLDALAYKMNMKGGKQRAGSAYANHRQSHAQRYARSVLGKWDP